MGLLGEYENALERVRDLKGLWDANNKVLKLGDDAKARLDQLGSVLESKQAFSVSLNKNPLPPVDDMQKSLLSIVGKEAGGDARERWFRLAWAQLQLQQVRSSEGSRELLRQFVASVDSDAVDWEGIPEESRKRYVKSIAETGAKLQEENDSSE